MLRLKSCPRCNGDIWLDWDQYGWYEQCLQCGYMHDLVGVGEVEQKLTSEEKNKLSRLLKRGYR